MGKEGRFVRKSRRRGQGGQGLVEFALIGTLFFLILAAIVNGSWLIFASVTATNAARNAARWAIAEQNYGSAASFCSSSDSGLLQAAAEQAGPFAGRLAGGIGVSSAPVTLNGIEGCQVTVSLPTGGLMGVLQIGPVNVKGSSTAYIVS